MPNNESSELQLGTEVEIIGPSNSGGMSRTGKKFVISEILTRIDSKSYSADNLSWYPASSLRVVQKFKKGDRVYCEHGESVICPGNWIDKKTGTVNDPDYITGDGIKCVIVDWDDNSKRTSVMAEDLQLVTEELKIGDWVEVIGPIGKEYIATDNDPLVFQISEIRSGEEKTYRVKDSGKPGYPASSLRKLTPEEIKQYTAPIASKIKQFDGEIAHLLAYVQECLIESGDVEARAICREMKINDRLSAIEHRESAICKYNIETEQRLQKLEAFQKLLSQLEIRQDNHGKRLADVEFILSEMKKIFKTKDRSVNFIFETV